MLIYFKIAERLLIIDKPNQRSSHTIPTIRGGGVVFVLALLMWFVFSGFRSPYFAAGAFLIAIISFADDMAERPAAIRFSVQSLAFLLMMFQVGVLNQPWLIVSIVVIVGIGTINAFNFMDGINGITGIYALVNFSTFLYLTTTNVIADQKILILIILLAVVVFLYFNFRRKARCFAGDVGSVMLAFVQLFLLLQLVFETHDYSWILMFLVFGVDSVVTIIYRLKRKENIFKPHRTHLYQYFSNELGKSHLVVSLIYGLVQAVINFLLISHSILTEYWMLFIFLTGIIYALIREGVLKKIGVKGIFG